MNSDSSEGESEQNLQEWNDEDDEARYSTERLQQMWRTDDIKQSTLCLNLTDEFQSDQTQTSRHRSKHIAQMLARVCVHLRGPQSGSFSVGKINIKQYKTNYWLYRTCEVNESAAFSVRQAKSPPRDKLWRSRSRQTYYFGSCQCLGVL